MKGGKRTGAGRKPCTDRKQQMTIYVLTSENEQHDEDSYLCNAIMQII